MTLPSTDELSTSVVLVEDSTVFARAVTAALTAQPDHEFSVNHFTLLSDAAKHVRAEGADCVLLDLGLPDAQGIEALRLLQAAAPEVSIVVLSGVEDERLALQAVQEGAQDYLVKGRADAELITRSIRYAVERKRAEQQRAAYLRERAARAEAEGFANTMRQLESLTEAALSQLPLDDLFDALLDRVVEMLEVDTAAILLLDDEREVLEVRAARGLERAVESAIEVPLGKGFAGRIAAEKKAIVIDDMSQSDVVSPVLRASVSSAIGVPLMVDRRVIGTLHVGTSKPRRFRSEETSLLQLAADRAAMAIERTRVFQQEHETAVTLQRSLLPDKLPVLPNATLAARYMPGAQGTEVGGDWYDVLSLPDGRVGLAMGDVVGRGIPAASLMGELRNGLRAYALEGHSPAAAVERLDRLVQMVAPGRMATLLFGVLEADGRRFTYANAGHLPPLVVAPGHEAVLHDEARSVPLGVLPYSTFAETSIAVEPGSTLFLCTDGLVEVRGESIDLRLELLRVLASHPVESPDELCQHLMSEMLPDGPGSDDVAMLAVTTAPAAGDHLALTLPAEPEALVAARRALRMWLGEVGAGPDETYDITLATGEACTNAIEHAYTPGEASFHLEASRGTDDLTIRVRDHGQWRAPRGTNRGRGLKLMETLMDEVTVDRTDEGTTVELRKRIGA
jgi:serine phosphatase RsbU (regulator of sigma subunit)/anti-sigma regulatory factor (Ser/Thr protein kinase)/DNA-binding NarL/FixJ family response regulator